MCSHICVLMKPLLLFFFFLLVEFAHPNSVSCPEVSLAQRAKHCKKDCLIDDDCKKHKRCMCDGECGLTCVNPAATCQSLPNIENGFIRTAGDSKFGSNAEYGCNKGYILIGASQRRCQANREWSSSPPVCRLQVKCGPPPEIPYAVHDGASFYGEYDLDSEVAYNCVPGYHKFNAKGLSISKCLLNRKNVAQWFGPDLRCKPRSCPDPGEIENGIRDGDNFEFPHQVKYSCLPGFLLVGSSVRQCSGTGEWTNDPATCKASECARPSAPLHGKVVGSSLTYQSVVTYSCDSGFRLVGQVQRICLAEGIWGGNEPKCEEIRCPILPTLPNGYIEGGETSYGSIAVFRCLETMTQEGKAKAKCMEDGQWSAPMPRCLASCVVPGIQYGRIRDKSEGQLIASGGHVEVVCNDKYEANIDKKLHCNNASWSHVPVCTPLSCHNWPPRVPHARILFSKSSHGSIAKYECKNGYHPNQNNQVIKCMHGEWIKDGPPFKCLPSWCDHPKKAYGTLEGGQILLEGILGAYEFQNYIQKVEEGRAISFQCSKGNYLIGAPKATCVNGEWMPKVSPKCVSQTHPMIEGRILWDKRRKRSIGLRELLRRHRRSLHQSARCPSIQTKMERIVIRKFEDSLSVICREGYELDDHQNHGKSSCINNNWQPPIAECKPKSCQIPIRLHVFFLKEATSQILQSNDIVEHGTVALMACIRGYQLNGNGVLECDKGNIVESLGHCLPQECVLPELPIGRFEPTAESIKNGENIQLICPTTNSTILCTQGILSPNPTCFDNRLRFCVPPQDNTPALIYRVQGAKTVNIDRFQSAFPNGTTFQFKCNDKEEASGIECVNGEWVSNLLPCVSANFSDWKTPQTSDMCSPLEVDPSKKVFDLDNYVPKKSHKFAHGTILHVGCKTSNNIAESVPMKCRRGKWTASKQLNCSSEAPSCELKIDTNSLLVIFDVNKRDPVLFNQFFADGSKLRFRCSNIGMERLQGQNEIICREGSWSHPLPHCTTLNALVNSVPIKYKIHHGTHSISSKGELIVSRAANIIFQCLSKKTLPDPIWKVTSTYRTYPTQWVKTYNKDREQVDAYELSIASAQPFDSGLLHCILPNGIRNSIKLVVTNSRCPPLVNTTSLNVHLSAPSLFIGTTAQFSCTGDHKLEGSATSTCLPDATWSRPLPKCAPTKCPVIVVNGTRMAVSVSTFSVGGVAHFRCHNGFTLVGVESLQCTSNGIWNGEFPKCHVVNCAPVDPPLNGHIIGKPKTIYAKGDIVLFGCMPDHMQTGGDFSLCQSDGKWSQVKTKCDPYCRHPGRPNNGASTSSAKDYYLVGEKIVFYCPSQHYKLSSENVLVCEKAGQWSRKLPLCLPVTPNLP